MPVTNPWKTKAMEEAAAKEAQLQQQNQPASSKPAANKFGEKVQETETLKNVEQAQSRRSKFLRNEDKNNKSIEKETTTDKKANLSDEEGLDDQQVGRIKNLAGFFATQKDDPKNVKKKRFELADDPETIILENEPTERLEGVVRADDPGEWQKPIELEKGWAKNMASMFQNRQQTEVSTSKKPFKMDIDHNAETIILENEPVRLEGVVRCVDKTEDVIGKRGRIKNIAGKFANPSVNDDDDDGEFEVSSSYKKNHIELEAGRTRNIADRWKQQQEESSSPKSSSDGATSKPKWMLELESATEYGVYENEPEVRSDVVRADDEQPDVISAQHSRNLRKMWSQIEKEEMSKDKEPKRSDILVRPKKKEPSPEPPPPPPVEEPKLKRFGNTGGVRANVGTFGAVYGKLAKKEKTPPPPEPEPPKKGVRHVTQQQVAPTEIKDSKMLSKPTPKSLPKKKF